MRLSRGRFLPASAAVASALGYTKKAAAIEVALGEQSYNYIKRQARTRVFSCSPLPAHDNPVEAWVEDDPMTVNLLTGKRGRQVVEVSGVTESNRSRGRVSAADASSWLQLSDGDRLMQPLKRAGARGSGKWQPISWQQALGEIGAAVNSSRPEGVALLRGKDTSAGAWDRFLHTIGSNTVIELDDMAQLSNLFQANGWTLTTAVCMMLFSLLHYPCGTTSWTIYRETGSWKWTAFANLMPLGLAILVCAAVAQTSRLRGG